MSASDDRRATAVFGGGCFWCTEAIFRDLRGVHDVESGYAGGDVPAPNYEQVCSGRTGHAEVVRVTYDPSQVAYADLLRVHLTTHDPTTPNRQGADVGTQYRSIVLAADEAEARIARDVIAELEPAYERPIVTEVQLLDTFYLAESVHQDFYRQNPGHRYCQLVIEPKLAKFRQRLQGG